MLTEHDPATLRARASAHAARPTGLQSVLLGGEPGALREAVADLGDRPGLLLVTEADAPEVAQVAAALGLEDRGTVPLMAADLDVALAEAPTAGVERAVDAAGFAEVEALVAAAFGLRGEPGLRHDLHEVPGADAWLLRDERGCAVSAVVTTADPDLLGLWSMATPPALQRRGHGGRLLRAVLGHYALEGAASACVVATPAGERLYRSLGFEPSERLQVWMKR
jgi:ribosomal protein S18 acetylase RimI-like enzyme